MILSNIMIEVMATLVANDENYLASADANKIHLVIADFAPSPTLSPSDLTLGDTAFTGSSPISIPIGPQNLVRDSGNTAQGILLKEPVGGLKWICTVAPAEAVQVYGVALITNDDSTLIASVNLSPKPQTIQFVGDFIEVSAILGFWPLVMLNPRTALTPLV